MSRGSIATSLLAIAETFRISAPTVVETLLRGGAERAVCTARLASWSAALLRHARLELEVRGQEQIPETEETFVVMSNHQSNYDVPVLFQAFPRTIRMVAKTELYRIPVFGGALTAAEFIEIDRHDRESARRSLAVARDRIKSGINVWIAPEGTRSKTGRVGKFKKGGFVLALETQTRILPVTIDGTRHVLPAHGALVRRGHHVTVTFHAPIDAPAYGLAGREQLVDDVRAAIVSALPPELREPA